MNDKILKEFINVFTSDKSSEEMAAEMNALEKTLLQPYISQDPQYKFQDWAKLMLNKDVQHALLQFGTDVRIIDMITGTDGVADYTTEKFLDIINMDLKRINLGNDEEGWTGVKAL